MNNLISNLKTYYVYYIFNFIIFALTGFLYSLGLIVGAFGNSYIFFYVFTYCIYTLATLFVIKNIKSNEYSLTNIILNYILLFSFMIIGNIVPTLILHLDQIYSFEFFCGLILMLCSILFYSSLYLSDYQKTT